MEQPLKQRRSKVNGRFMQEYIGKEITILGEVTGVQASSGTFQMKTTDGFEINVIMKRPFDEVPMGWVEVRGSAQGKKAVLGYHLIVFPYEIFKDFDVQLYNDYITVINTFDNPWVNSD